MKLFRKLNKRPADYDEICTAWDSKAREMCKAGELIPQQKIDIFRMDASAAGLEQDDVLNASYILVSHNRILQGKLTY